MGISQRHERLPVRHSGEERGPGLRGKEGRAREGERSTCVGAGRRQWDTGGSEQQALPAPLPQQPGLFPVIPAGGSAVRKPRWHILGRPAQSPVGATEWPNFRVFLGGSFWLLCEEEQVGKGLHPLSRGRGEHFPSPRSLPASSTPRAPFLGEEREGVWVCEEQPSCPSWRGRLG